MTAAPATAGDFVVCYVCQRATRREDITRVDAVGGEPLCPECEQEVTR